MMQGGRLCGGGGCVDGKSWRIASGGGQLEPSFPANEVAQVARFGFQTPTSVTVG